MFIELVDILRCPEPHEETWLVAAVDTYEGRHIASGTLGCPVCGANYPVADGAAAFAAPVPAAPPLDVPGEEDVFRARALLGLSDPGGVIALVGDAARFAGPLAAEGAVEPLLLNPIGVFPGASTSAAWVGARAPLAPGSLRGVLVGVASDPRLVESLVRALRPRGRLVAPVDLPVPVDVVELARDAREWVGERVAESRSAPVALRRR